MRRPQMAAKKRSLLGYDDFEDAKDDENGGLTASDYLKQQNQASYDRLEQGVGLLHGAARDIDLELQRSVAQMSELQGYMGSTKEKLAEMMTRLGTVAETAGSRHMFYLIAFTVIVLFVLYYWLRG